MVQVGTLRLMSLHSIHQSMPFANLSFSSPTLSLSSIDRIESPPPHRHPQIGSACSLSSRRHPPVHLHPALNQALKHVQLRQGLQALAQPHAMRATLKDV